MKYAIGSARIASVIVTAAATPIVRSVIVRSAGSWTSCRKLSRFQRCTTSLVNGSTDQNAATRSATSASR